MGVTLPNPTPNYVSNGEQANQTVLNRAVTQVQANVVAVNNAMLLASEKGAANGVATLGADSKIPSSQLPAVAITDVYSVANIAARDALTVEEGDVAIVADAGSGQPDTYIYDGSTWLTMAKPTAGVPAEWGFAISDETSDLETGVKITLRMPYAMTLSEVRASVATAPVGANLIFNIKQNGTSVLSTLLSIDAGEKTSETASTPAVISTTALTDDSEITVEITQIGSTTAGAGAKILLKGVRA